MSTCEAPSGPLKGIRILDLSRLLPGPLCAQHLAYLGAEVIKIEDTDQGDYARPALRNLVNRGKKAIRINLKHEQGKEVFKTLVKNADVVLEGFRPGTLGKLGVGYETLHQLNPRLVFCSITGYGQTGPRSHNAGHDLNYIALTGILDQTGTPDSTPVLPGFLIGDILGGTLSAAMGILAALVEAQTTGIGRMVDVSMADAILSHSVLALADINDHGRTAKRGEGPHTGATPQYNIYETADSQFIVVAAQEKKFWDTFCITIGRADLMPAHGKSGSEGMATKNEIASIIRRQSLAQWCEKFKGTDCCFSPVLSLDKALTDEQVIYRKAIQKVGSEYRITLPFQMSGLEIDATKPSPDKGQHTDEVLENLGFNAQQISTLRKVGAIR